ncbi:transposase [Streptosporangium sp. NPDC023963]|uniref:transposase n=1 Tax=Streptosporangium sp. NPDC023963 TaxID=3155608 RepID=UPI00342F0062
MGADRAAATCPALGRRPDKHPRREVVHAIMCVVRTCCSWRQLPADFPPWQTVYWHFVRWEDQEVTRQIVDVLHRWVRRSADHEAEPSATILDSQSVRGTDPSGPTVAAATRTRRSTVASGSWSPTRSVC